MGLFDHSSSSSNHTCPGVTQINPVQSPIVNGITFHQLATIISGACLAFTCVVSFYLIFRHATHFSIPKEQKQIIRIIFTIPVFAFISLLSVAFEDAAIYLKPIEDVYEAFALASFFLLLCAYVQEDDVERQSFFNSTGTIGAYKKTTIAVFQFPVVMAIILVVTVITQATGSYCATSNKPYFAHIWVTVITIFSTVVAITSILRFYKAVKSTINHRKPLSKLVAFKGIVFLNFIQNAIFSFLSSSNDLHPTNHMTFNDLTIALPNLILSVEMVIFSLAFLYVYRTREYIHTSGASAVPLGHGGYQGGFMGVRAYIAALNIVDMLKVPLELIGRGNSGASNGMVWVTGRGTEYESVALNPQEHHHQAPEAYHPASQH